MGRGFLVGISALAKFQSESRRTEVLGEWSGMMLNRADECRQRRTSASVTPLKQ